MGFKISDDADHERSGCSAISRFRDGCTAPVSPAGAVSQIAQSAALQMCQRLQRQIMGTQHGIRPELLYKTGEAQARVAGEYALESIQAAGELKSVGFFEDH